MTYSDNDYIKEARLFNGRTKDFSVGAGIPEGEIVAGLHGYAIAEVFVPGVTAKTVEYCANGKCSWSVWELECMYLPGGPKGKTLKGRNYIVAELSSDRMIEVAEEKGLKVFTDQNGRRLVNLEIDEFKGQMVERRAKLL